MVSIDYKKITNDLRTMFASVVRNHPELDLKWSLDEEQAFLKKDKDSDTSLFIVIQYGEANISLKSYVLEANFVVLGLANNIDVARTLLTEFASTYNLTSFGDAKIIVNTPTISSNFNEVSDDWRSLYTMQSVIVGGSQLVDFDSLTYEAADGTKETIPVLDFNDSTTNNLQPQVYGDSKGRTRSYTVSQTYTFSIKTYSLDTSLTRDINEVKYGNESKENASFVFTLKLKNGKGFSSWSFHLLQADFASSLGNIPAISLSFTL